ncbi:hypothetical protein E4U16_003097 [Claviceps sp. LM84 group G4]|nr:hypothetical protein E4U16_003097 [Claviceps sp. LM84 group G4]KAG6086333.1 hypothetical protein E4U33_006152 [Claviceps sp. LM78 group G4]
MRGDSALLPCKVSQLTIATDCFTGQLRADSTPHRSSRGRFTAAQAITSSILRRSITERTSYITRITQKISASGEPIATALTWRSFQTSASLPLRENLLEHQKAALWLHSQMGHALPLRDDMQSLKEHRAEGGRDKERGRRVSEPA